MTSNKKLKEINADSSQPITVTHCVFNGKTASTNKYDVEAMCHLASAISENAKALKTNADALICAAKLMERRHGMEAGLKITQLD